MYVHVYKKETIFWLQVRCADIFILIFSLFHYYLKARIINFTTYKNISADHITTEFIIIKLIFESKNVKEPYNWHVTCISKWGCYWFFRSSVKSDYTFFHERKMSLFVYWMQGRLTSSTYISSFFVTALYHSRCHTDAGIYNRMKLEKTGRSCPFFSRTWDEELVIKIYGKIQNIFKFET